MSKYDRLDRFGVTVINQDEYERKQAYVIKHCKCQGCPTYVAGDAPTGYCFPTIGTSDKIHYEKECICKTCQIYKEYELNHSFYCTRCSQVCQTMKTEGAAAQGT
ncbi:MAG TPA: hypothetical protein DDW94_01580 [Deltaproteobacteria bacterium]|nr:MAG: hypothetical protein A2Z79_07810 [Deltaproteobacteria bacterium GWA2_55_82]OGQ65134.1 MAG: hypothetical protein A3I81_07230 [Deltaproteobacteria bacterium RIFCSPLOWO2_02_FULL_55_12]OIJ74740.1 MAG: hypothetical protein A2V21_310980 [Deltaproteobacteria bacterium GWC2_55_46]HBG45664.1 hypothetical protein [Deltaproteobacteria bacterium]HCY12143.1 hypothetical protein [Deltaproteobacteria bacterium]